MPPRFQDLLANNADSEHRFLHKAPPNQKTTQKPKNSSLLTLGAAAEKVVRRAREPRQDSAEGSNDLSSSGMAGSGETPGTFLQKGGYTHRARERHWRDPA